MNIAVAGSHGLIGNNLVTFFRKYNNHVSRIVRSKHQNGIFWDPSTGYINHEKLENLSGLELELIYEWEIGSMLIFDRTNLHCSSSIIEGKKIGLTTFTKK